MSPAWAALNHARRFMARWSRPLPSPQQPDHRNDVRTTSPTCNKASMGKVQADTAVSIEAVQAELERILASTCFRKSTRVSRFLRFTVETRLRAQGDPIKEY